MEVSDSSSAAKLFGPLSAAPKDFARTGELCPKQRQCSDTRSKLRKDILRVNP